MKIVHISTSDADGGAFRATYRLHDGLKRAGCESLMYVRHKSTIDSSVHRFHPSSDRFTWILRNSRRLWVDRALNRYAKTSPAYRTFFSQDRTCFYRESVAQIPPSDLVHLHWIAGFLDLGQFFSWLPKSLPLVWTLHDMASFTGGCCHDMGCGKFTQECGACPQLGSSYPRDLTRAVWQRKRKYYSSLGLSRFHIVTPSRWLGGEVGRSSLFSSFPRSVIPNGLDTEVFQPRDRHIARQVLGIPQDAKVVLFVSYDIHNPLKGFPLLMEALAGIQYPGKLFFLSIGSGTTPQFPFFPHAHIPSLGDDRLLSWVYSAADVFVAPSLADNLPNTILESLSCGTPVVAFNAGGMPEAVRPGVTGLLAKTGDSADLRSAILELVSNDSKRAELSDNSRRIALSEYALEVQASRYIALYSALLNQPFTARPAPASFAL